MVNQIPLPKRSKHDPVTLDEAEAVKKWMKYNNMNIARLKKIMVAVEKNPLGIGEQFYLIDLKKDLVRNLRLSEKVLGVQERLNLPLKVIGQPKL